MSASSHRGFCFCALATVLWYTGICAGEEKPAAAPAESKPARRLPPRIIEAVSAKLPKYEAPKAEAANSGDFSGTVGKEDQSGDILRLPDMKVTTAKQRPISSFDLLSLKGRLDVALKANPGLRIGPFSNLNNGIALAMQREEREVEARTSLADEVIRAAVPGNKESRDLVRKMRDAVARPNTEWRGK